MRARWIDCWGGPLQDGERPAPQPAEAELLIGVEACAIGLTVLNCIRGDLGSEPDDLPRIPGHELIGTVLDGGPGIDRDRIGERVAAYFYLFCGRCRRCLAGTESMCEDLGGFVGVNRDGGYAERVTLPARSAIPLPADIDPVKAVTVPDAVATALHVAARAGIAPGDRVAVIAAGGGVGIHAVQVAEQRGAEVLGLEAAPAKLSYLEDELGIPALDSSDFDRAELPATWEGAADVVVDLLGSDRSLRWAHDAVGPGGRMVVLTTFPGVEFATSPRQLVFRQASILGSRYASRGEVLAAGRMVHEQRIRSVVSQVVGPGEVEAAHEALTEGTLIGRAALCWS